MTATKITAPEHESHVHVTKPATAGDLSRTRVIQLLRRVVEDNWSLQRTARAMQLPYDVVEHVLTDHGGPDKTRLLWALDELIKPDPAPSEETNPEPAEKGSARPRPAFDPTAILARGMASTNPTLAARARKIEQNIRALANDLEEDREDARLRARIAQLQGEIQQLEGARKKAADERSARPSRAWTPADDGLFPCPAEGCNRRSTTPQGAATHLRKAHKEVDR